MAGGLNKVILIGHLGRDPEITYTPNGTAIGKFSLATTERRKTSDGNWEDQTEWHRIVTFGKTAEVASQYLAKGRQVYIEGRIQTRSWDDRDGQKRYMTEIVANRMLLLGRREGGERAVDESHDEPEPEQFPPNFNGGDIEDDLPF